MKQSNSKGIKLALMAADSLRVYRHQYIVDADAYLAVCGSQCAGVYLLRGNSPRLWPNLYALLIYPAPLATTYCARETMTVYLFIHESGDMAYSEGTSLARVAPGELQEQDLGQ
ncbi:MAG: hypothetical protein ACI9JM_000149 [Halioglobus sp.]|jgi:hypothetical protein